MIGGHIALGIVGEVKGGKTLSNSPEQGLRGADVTLPDASTPLSLASRRFRSRRDVALGNLVLRHQLQVALRTNAAPRLRNSDRILWVWFRRLWPCWRDHLLIVKPETVIRWHRKDWRLYWSWKSRTRLGRPRLSPEIRELIGTMSRDNRLWGTERIRGELLKVGIVVSKRSIRRYRWRKPTPAGSQTWRTFLSNQLIGIWAADLLVVHTINCRVLYVLLTTESYTCSSSSGTTVVS